MDSTDQSDKTTGNPDSEPETKAVLNQIYTKEVQIYKQQDIVKQVAESLKNALDVYQSKVGTLSLVKTLKTGLPSLAILKKDTHAYNTTKIGLNLHERLEGLYNNYNHNVINLLSLLGSLNTHITTLEQKFKMMIEDLTIKFDYKYFEIPLQKVMTISQRINPELFEEDVIAILNEVAKIRRELADLSTELPQGDSSQQKQQEKEKKLKEAQEKRKDVINEKTKLEQGVSRCEALISSYTDKQTSLGEKIYKLKEEIDEIEDKIKEYQGMKYKEAEEVTNRLNELRTIEYESLKDQQNKLTNDKDRIREKQQELMVQFEEQIADAVKKLQVYQQAGQLTIDFHLIFVLDESGSLSGHFNDVEQAFQNFIQSRKQKNSKDIVSVIKFNSVGTLIYERQPITCDFSNVKLTGGGTDFVAAFQEVSQLLSNSGSQQVPVVIFMTDGQDSRISAATTLVEQIHRQFTQMMLFAIAFSDSVDMSQIKAIVRAGNGGSLERTAQGKTYQMVMSCKNQLSLVNAFKEVSNACNQLDDIKTLIETLKDQKQKMIEDNKRATEDLYKLHEERILQQLDSSKNINTKVTENSKDSHIDQLIQEEQKRKSQCEGKKKDLEKEDTTLKEEHQNEEGKKNQLNQELESALLSQKIADCQAEEERLRKIFEEGKEYQTAGGYEILSKPQLEQMNHSVETLLSIADDIKYEYKQMKTFIEDLKDSLSDTDKTLKDINLNQVKSSAMKEQGFYDILIELNIFEETDVYPEGRDGKLYPKNVTTETLQQLYEQLLKLQIEKHPDLLTNLLDILGDKEALLSDMKAKININIYNGNSSSSTVDSEVQDEEEPETQEEDIKMKIYELVDSDYCQLVKEIKDKEKDIRKNKKDIRDLKSQQYLKKNNITNEDAKEQIVTLNEDLKQVKEELKELKKLEKENVKPLKGDIKALENAVQALKHAVERKIQLAIEKKPRELLKNQYYIFKNSIHENVEKFIALLNNILEKK